MDKGEPGFAAINYRGRQVVPDVPQPFTRHMSFGHMRMWSSETGKFTRHACLLSGYWCWANVLEHPLDLVRYIDGGEWLV